MKKSKLNHWLGALAIGVAFVTGGCGSDDDSSPANTTATTTGTGTTSTTTTTTATVSTGSLALALSSGTVVSGSPVTATATLKDSAGVGIAGVVVTFTTDASYGVLAPVTGTALTDASGNASITLASAGFAASGASTLAAKAEVGGQNYSVTRGYTVGAASVAITTPTFGVGAGSLSAFGSTSVNVVVTAGGIALGNQLVTFTSPCATAGKASLSSSALTNAAGQAVASYQDKGCGAVDPISVSASGLANSQRNLTVLAAAVGSIQYVSALPNYITLKGSGGAGRQESSLVKFKVVDSGNNPVGGKTVNFSLSTAIGGLRLVGGDTDLNGLVDAVSDPVTGEVQVLVAAGTVATPVRVFASTAGAGTTLATQSDQLTVSVGLPDQDSASLSVGTLNIEGWNYDGTQTTLTMALGDVFNNPVPDGTAVNFITEGGVIGTVDGALGPVGSCLTVNSKCSVALSSQNPRPANGRVSVLAYAVGEESFTDTNGDGAVTLASEFAGIGQGTGEAFLDSDFDGARDANELFLDFDGDKIFDVVDAQYNGSMCTGAFCSTRKTTHVFKNVEIVFSASDASISIAPAGGDLGGCMTVPAVTPSVHFTVRVQNSNGNPMPAGTTVTITAANGTLVGDTSYVVPNSSDVVLAPQLSFDLVNDCAEFGVGKLDATPSGNLKVVVKTPKGVETISSVSVSN